MASWPVIEEMRSLLLLSILAAPLLAQAAPPHTALPSRVELDSITARGIALAQYDRAAWDASDALIALDPNPHGAQHYIVVENEGRWFVYFGALTTARDTFYIAYSAEKAAADSVFRARKFPIAIPNTGDQLHAARALVTALEAFGPTKRPYNHAVLPTRTGEWWVYIYPAQTVTTVWPLGGDERFRVSADGSRIIERHRMHVSILETPVNLAVDSAGRVPQGYVHTTVVDNRPEDTDVFAVLSRGSRFPEYVAIKPGFVYRIDSNGHITLPMRL